MKFFEHIWLIIFSILYTKAIFSKNLLAPELLVLPLLTRALSVSEWGYRKQLSSGQWQSSSRSWGQSLCSFPTAVVPHNLKDLCRCWSSGSGSWHTLVLHGAHIRSSVGNCCLGRVPGCWQRLPMVLRSFDDTSKRLNVSNIHLLKIINLIFWYKVVQCLLYIQQSYTGY